MAHFPNFKEFYGKAIVPMGKHDYDVFSHKFALDKEKTVQHTHWMIAIEGGEDEAGKTKWRVVIYPAALNGASWNFDAPHYETISASSFEEAMKIAQELEEQSLEDTLISAALLTEVYN